MKSRIVVLGAGFGGLELSTLLSEALGDQLELTLIDKNDTFYFGYSKFEVMFGRKTAEAVQMPYREIVKPGVHFVQETIISIDPASRRVTTDKGVYDADFLVVALGADYDIDATPGLREGGNEFYSFAGAERLRDVLPNFTNGRAVVNTCHWGRAHGAADAPRRRECPGGRPYHARRAGRGDGRAVPSDREASGGLKARLLHCSFSTLEAILRPLKTAPLRSFTSPRGHPGRRSLNLL